MILWLIKLVLVILLALCGLVVVLVGVILLAPVRYQIYFEKYDQLIYEITFRYLYGINGYFKLEAGKREEKLKVFWKVLNEHQIEKDKKDKKDNKRKKVKSTATKNINKDDRKQIVKTSKKVISKKAFKGDRLLDDEKEENKQFEKHASRRDKKIQSKSQFDGFLLRQRWFYAALGEVIILLKNIFYTIKPKVFSFECVLGEEDPADTGELIAKLTMLFPIYYKYGIIRGDYERSCREGGFLAEGRFRLGTLVKHFICFLTKQSVRKTIKYLMKK